MARIGTAYVEVTGDLTKLNRALGQVDEKLKRVNRMRAEGKLGLDTSSFDRAIKEGEARLARLDRKRSRAVLDLDVKGIAVADAEIATLKHQLATLKDQRIKVDVDRRPLAAFGVELDRVRERLTAAGGGIGAFNRNFRFMGNLVTLFKWPAFVVGAGLATQAISALTAGVTALAGSLSTVAGLAGTVPQAFLGLAQSVGTSLLAFQGIGDAIKKSVAAQQQGSFDAGQSLQQQRAATDAVRSAEQGLTQAQQQENIAQHDLTLARKDATRQLQDMENAAIDARLAEQGASLSLREAQQELQRVSTDPKSTQLEIERATLGVKAARQSLQEARLEANRTQTDQARAQRKGVEGSDQVVQARRAVADSARNTRNAELALTRAQEGLAAQSKAASASQRNLAIAMANLSPAGQSFVRFLLRLKPRLDELRATAQQGLLPGIEKGIQAAMPLFEPLRRVIGQTARAMGGASVAFGRFLGSKSFRRDFAALGESNAQILRRLGRSSVNFAKALTNIAIAAKPLTEWLSKITLRFSQWLVTSTKAGRETGKLGHFFEETRQTLQRLGSILGSTGHALITIGSIGKKYLGDFLLKELDKSAQSLEDFTNSVSGRNKIRDYFVAAREPLKQLGGLVGDVVKAMLTLGSQPGFTKLIKTIRSELLPTLTRVIGSVTEAFGPALISTLASIVVLFGKLAGTSGPLTIFVRTIGKMADVFSWLLDNVPFLRSGLVNLAGAFAVYKALSFTSAITGMRDLVRVIRRLGATALATKTGESIVSNTTLPLRGIGAKVRQALGGIRGIFRRIFARAGSAAGEAAAGSAAGTLAGETAAGGRFGKLGGRFRGWGMRMGRLAGIGFAVGFVAFAGIEIIKHRNTIIGWGRQIRDWIDENVPFADKFPKVDVGGKGPSGPEVLKGRPKVGAVERGGAHTDFGATPSLAERHRLAQANIRAGRKQADDAGKDAEKGAREHRPKKVRIKTVEIDPIATALLGTPRHVREQMAKISRALQRGFDAIREKFSDVRVLRRRDPLHLGETLLRSRDDATRAAKRIRANIIEVFRDFRLFHGGDPLALGSAILHSRDEATRAAKAIRSNIQRVFDDLRLLRGGDPLHLGAAVLHSRDEATRSAKKIRDNIAKVFGTLPGVVARPTTKMLRIVGSALRALGASGIGRVSASIERIEGRAFGGMIPGYSKEDDRLIAVRGGEAVLTPEFHRPEVEHALAFTKSMGAGRFGSLGEMFRKSGAAFQAGGDVAQRVVQRVVPAVSKVPTLYQDVVQRFARGGLFGRANQLDHLALPYVWGGHHGDKGAIQNPRPGLDCSSAVSYVLGIPPRVSGGFMNYGEPGPGPVSIFANPSHVFMSIAGRGFGTSSENPDGGPGWLSYNSRPGFEVRHATGDVGGPIAKIGRLLVRGAGATKGLVRGDLQRVKTAGNRRIDKEMEVGRGFGDDGFGSLRGPWRSVEKSIAGERGWDRGDWDYIIRSESGGKVSAKNPKSTAFGLGQLLDSTYGTYGGGPGSSGQEQIQAMARYISARYGNPTKAASFRRAHGFYKQGGFVSRFVGGFRRGGSLPGGRVLASALRRYDQLAERFSGLGEQLRTLQGGGTVQKKYGAAPTLATKPGDFGEYVVHGHAVKPSAKFLKRPRAGKRKKSRKTKKGQRPNPIEIVTGQVEDFSLQPYTATYADAAMQPALSAVEGLIDPDLAALEEDYTRAEGDADASEETYVVTEDKLGKSIAPFIDQTAVKRRLGELDTLIDLKSRAAAKMQQIIASVEYAIQLLVSGIRRRQAAVKAIEKKVEWNNRRIDDLDDKLTKDGGGGINAALRLLNEKGFLSEHDERHVRRIWRAIFDDPIPVHTEGKHKGDIVEGEAKRRFENTQARYQGRIRSLKAQNIALAGSDGLKSRVIDNSTQVWEPNIDTMEEQLTTYRGHAGWLGFDPYKAGLVDDLRKLLPPANADQRAAYKPWTGSLGEALWTLERDPHPFPDGSLISERAELLNRPGGGVLDTLLKTAQANYTPEQPGGPAEVKAFLAAYADVLKQYGSNIQRTPFRRFAGGVIPRIARNVLPSFAGGGVIEGPKRKPVVIEGHGGEVVFDPTTKSLTIKVDQKSSGERQIIQNNEIHYAAPKPEPHALTRTLRYELESAI